MLLDAKRDRGLAMTIRVSTVFWALFLGTLVISYAIIFAGALGAVSTQVVSVVALSGAAFGCVAAAAFVIAARHDLSLH